MSGNKVVGARLGFEKECVSIPIVQIHMPVTIPLGTKSSAKYRQILSSVRSIGLVEPLVVSLDRATTGRFLVLDGRVRLEALKDLGIESPRVP